MRLRHIILFLLMAVFVTPIRAGISTDYLLGGSLTLKNGKELDLMHGLNTYDYGARQYDPILARWDRVDPLCEKKPWQSPYIYAGTILSDLLILMSLFITFLVLLTLSQLRLSESNDACINCQTGAVSQPSACKVTKSREQNKKNSFYFLPRRSKFAIFDGKGTISMNLEFLS